MDLISCLKVIERWHKTKINPFDYEFQLLMLQRKLKHFRLNIYILNSAALKIQHLIFNQKIKRFNRQIKELEKEIINEIEDEERQEDLDKSAELEKYEEIRSPEEPEQPLITIPNINSDNIRFLESNFIFNSPEPDPLTSYDSRLKNTGADEGYSAHKNTKSMRKIGSNPKVKNIKNFNSFLFSINTPVLKDKSKPVIKNSKSRKKSKKCDSKVSTDYNDRYNTYRDTRNNIEELKGSDSKPSIKMTPLKQDAVGQHFKRFLNNGPKRNSQHK